MSRARRFASTWRALKNQFDEVADVPWWHPAWLGLVGGIAALEALGRGDADDDGQYLYLAANGGPAADNFMGREAAAPVDIAEAAVAAALRARAVVDAVAEVDGALPGQPLTRLLAWRGGWLERAGVSSRAVALVAADRAARVDVETATDDQLVAGAIALALGRELPPGFASIERESVEPVDAIAAVAVGPTTIECAQHVHRNAWTRGGGPWLGVGDAPPLWVATTCHVAVDGFGHALVTDAIGRRLDAVPPDVRSRLLAVARNAPGAHAAPPALEPPPGALHLGFAGRYVAGGVGRFAHQAYAFARALDAVYSDASGPSHTPTFHVPVAPGRLGADDRRRRRVVHALLAARRRDGAIESFDEFAARLAPFIEREVAGLGALPRISRAAANAPLPLEVRRRLLVSKHRSRRSAPPFEVLSGRGRFSSMRFPRGERPASPLYAVSTPTLQATDEDPRGAVVLTLIHHENGCSVTSSGTGRMAGTGARDFLDRWLEELERIPK